MYFISQFVLVFSFNPRSYKRSDKCGFPGTGCLALSIHAPTRGATNPIRFCVVKFLLSIHAPTRGATATSVLPIINDNLSIHAPTRGATMVTDMLQFLKIFQSTLLQEERPLNKTSLSNVSRLSIHAPTRGATHHFFHRKNQLYFQSTLLQEERHHLHLIINEP